MHRPSQSYSAYHVTRQPYLVYVHDIEMVLRPRVCRAMGELVTPTGAALVKALAAGRFGQPPPFTPTALGET